MVAKKKATKKKTAKKKTTKKQSVRKTAKQNEFLPAQEPTPLLLLGEADVFGDLGTIANEKGFYVARSIDCCIEIFPRPLPAKIADIDSIRTPDDLFRMSSHFGYGELFVPTEKSVLIGVGLDEGPDAEKIEISRNEFIDFQLMQLDINTLYEYPSRVDGFSEEELLLKFLAPGVAVDENGYPVDEEDIPDWYGALGSYLSIHEPENPADFSDWQDEKNKGIAFLEQFKEEEPALFCEQLRKNILDSYCGVHCYLETEITETSYMDVVYKYSKWNCNLMIVTYGDFEPYYPRNHENLRMDAWRVRKMFVRNYDEGSVLEAPIAEKFSGQKAAAKLTSAKLAQYVSKIRKLLTKRDYSVIDSGIELARSLNNPAVFKELLIGCKFKEGQLFRNLTFVGIGSAKPYVNYALISTLAHAPEDCTAVVTLRQSITQLEMVLVSTAPLAAFTNLESLDLSGSEDLQSLDDLTNCTKLTRLDLGGCSSLENVDGLANLSKLNSLDLSGCSSLPVSPADDEMTTRKQVAAYQERIKKAMK